MGVLEIVGGIVMLIVCAVICIVVVLQESPKGSGINALSGGDSYFSQNQGRTKDAMLARITRIAGVAFFIITILVYGFSKWFKII